MFPELQQPGVVPAALQSLFHAHCPLVQNLFLITNLTFQSEAAQAQRRALVAVLGLMPSGYSCSLWLPGHRLLTHIQLAINQSPQAPFHGSAHQPVIPQSVCIARFVPS